MERFRGFLHAFYSAKLGRYPPLPPPKSSGVFRKEAYHTMRFDFECLRDLLVDESDSGTATGKHATADKSGIDILQMILSYDMQWHYKTQKHPLPLLPDISGTTSTWRRMTRLRGDKLKPDERLLAHASLVKAYNTTNPRIIHNDLVQAYRRFEEDLVMSPSRFDKKERLTLPDGRKLRWAIIYAICQVLRNVTEPPREVFDTDGIDYNIAISTEGLPPWKMDLSARPETPRRRSMFVENFSPEGAGAPSPMKSPTTPRRHGHLSEQLLSPTKLGRSISYRAKTLSQSIQVSPNNFVCRPLSVFRSPPPPQNSPRTATLDSTSQTPTRPARPPRLATEPTELPRPTTSASVAVRSFPLAGNRANLQLDIHNSNHQNQDQRPIEDAPMTATSSSSVQESVASSSGAENSASSIATSPEASPKQERINAPWSEPPLIPLRHKREVLSMLPSPETPVRSHMRPRPQSAIFVSQSSFAHPPRPVVMPDYAMGYAQLVEEQREEIYNHEEVSDDKLVPSPLRIKKSVESLASFTPGDDKCLSGVRREFGGLDEVLSASPACL